MKKILSILMAAVMSFALVGCGIDGIEEAIVNDVVSYLEDDGAASAAPSEEAAQQTSAADEDTQADIAEDAEKTTSATEVTTQATTTQATTTEQTTTVTEPVVIEPTVEAEPTLDPDGSYTTKDDVALYIHLYGCLPSNFMTKKGAQALGWEGGSLEPYAPGMCIGGSHFGNYEGLLPEKDGRKYTECDIDTLGAKSRGAKRIVFSNDGLIYYTDDHYESFTLLYGEE